MSAPIVFISRNRIVGEMTAFAAAFERVVPLIRSTKRSTAVFAAYVDERLAEVRVVHVFADGAAMTAHFEGSDARSAAVADLIRPAGFEVYGSAPPAAIEQLRGEAARALVPFAWFPESLGGFVLGPGDGVDRPAARSRRTSRAR